MKPKGFSYDWVDIVSSPYYPNGSLWNSRWGDPTAFRNPSPTTPLSLAGGETPPEPLAIALPITTAIEQSGTNLQRKDTTNRPNDGCSAAEWVASPN